MDVNASIETREAARTLASRRDLAACEPAADRRNPEVDEMAATPRMGDLWNELAEEVARHVVTAEGGLV